MFADTPSTPQGLPPLLARAPTTEQLESLEDRLAQYGGLFREQAKDFVASLERSTDLDMRFLAVRLNFNYQFRTSRHFSKAVRSLTTFAAPLQGPIRRALNPKHSCNVAVTSPKRSTLFQRLSKQIANDGPSTRQRSPFHAFTSPTALVFSGSASSLAVPAASAPGSGFVAGKRRTSRIEFWSVRNMTKRSIPKPNPPVGGRPCSRASTKVSS